MRRAKYAVKLSEEERAMLVALTRKHSARQSIVRRARIILMSDEGMWNQHIATALGVESHVVTTWTKRWHDMADKPIQERLEDLPRPGAPDKFTPEQLCRIIALACEKPEEHGRPITEWTSRELADEAVKQGIVGSISPTHVGRILKKTMCSRTSSDIG